MSSSQERAKALAREIQDTMKNIKAAEARVKHLSQQLAQALGEARAEAEAALTVVVYPSGRYECAKCGQPTLFTEPTRELPACDNCGSRHYVGHEPQVTKYEPPPPPRYPAGMYQCVKCNSRTIVISDTEELSPCEVCDGLEFKHVQI